MLRSAARLLIRIVYCLVAAAFVGAGAFFLLVRASLMGPEPAASLWSEATEVPRAFPDGRPAALPNPSSPACPRGGFQPIRSPSDNITGKLVLTMILPWYGIPALMRRDPLLNMPSGSVRVRATDPYASRDPKEAWVAAIREDGDRFIEQARSGETMVLPRGRYRLQAAISSAPLRWGVRSVDVEVGAKLDIDIPLDRVAPEVSPVAPPLPVPAAGRMPLTWRGDAPDGLAVITRIGAKGGRPSYLDVRGSDHQTSLNVGGTPGPYVATYLLCAPLVPLARWHVDVGPSDAVLDMPDRVAGGGEVRATVRGSFSLAAQYQVVETADDRHTYDSGFVTAGNSIVFTAPLSGGDFEMTLFADDGPILAKRRLSVDPVPVTILAPKSVAFRQPAALGWRAAKAAKLQLQALPMLPAGWPSFYPTDTSSDAQPVARLWRLPPGKVALRLTDEQHPSFGIAETILDVTDGPAFVSPPASGKAGTLVEVAFTVPARDGDRIALVQPGYTTLEYSVASMLAAGARRSTILLPAAPGEYDLVYATVEGAGPDKDQMTFSGRTPIVIAE